MNRMMNVDTERSLCHSISGADTRVKFKVLSRASDDTEGALVVRYATETATGVVI